MTSDNSDPLATLRADFDAKSGGATALPMAGAIVWAATGIASSFLSEWIGTLALIVGTGLIFPLAILLSKPLGENIFAKNPLGTLMGLSTLMINLLWAVHLTLLFAAPSFIPLTLGISIGLHWVVFSWIIDHPVGIIHAVARTVLVTAAWWLFPDHRVTAVAAAVVLAYAYSLALLRRRKKAIRARSAG